MYHRFGLARKEKWHREKVQVCDAQRGGGGKKATNRPVTRNQAEVDEQKKRERERE